MRAPGRRWYADPAAWRVIGLAYLPLLGGLNLAWEVAHLPLYTLWTTASPDFIAFAVFHCTLGDVVIGMAALGLALVVVRAPELERWHWTAIAASTALFGSAYTVISEWMNTAAGHWAYSSHMPTLSAWGHEIGVSPLAQWLLLPPLCLRLARWSIAHRMVPHERRS